MKYIVTVLIVGFFIDITTVTTAEFFCKYSLVLMPCLLAVSGINRNPNPPAKAKYFKYSWIDRQYKKDMKKLDKEESKR